MSKIEVNVTATETLVKDVSQVELNEVFVKDDEVYLMLGTGVIPKGDTLPRWDVWDFTNGKIESFPAGYQVQVPEKAELIVAL